MARAVAELPPGARITDYISLGVVTKTFPLSAIGAVLLKTGKASIRQRDLPAPGGCLLRHCAGAVHAIVLSRGVALFAGRSPVVERSIGLGAGGWQIGHLSGPRTTWVGAAATTAR